MIENTVYLNEESERKQLTMPFWAYEWLKSAEGESMTKGLKTYEVVMFVSDEYEDSLTETESFVDEQLESLSSERFVKTVEKIKSEKGYHPWEEYDDEDRVSDVNIHLPTSLDSQLTRSRYLGDMIADMILEFYESAYTDRLDRINCKKELIRWFEDNRVSVEHRVAEAIIEGDTREYDVEEAHRELQLLREDRWWKSDSVTIDILMERGNDIPQGVSKRATALQTAVLNSGGEYSEQDIYNLADTIYDVGEKTIEKYVSEIDMRATSSDTVYIDMKEIARQVVDPSEVESYNEFFKLDDVELIEGEFTKYEVSEQSTEIINRITKFAIPHTAKTKKDKLESMREYMRALRSMMADDHTPDDDEGAQKVIRAVALEEQ